jgi:membrane protease YdiL (CAAX protease family)
VRDAGSLLLFVVLSCAISWTALALLLIAREAQWVTASQGCAIAANYGPSLAALFASAARGGEPALRRLLRSAVRVEGGVGIWAAAVLVPAALRGAGLGTTDGPIDGLTASAGLVLLVELWVTRFLYGGGLGEELGWRGFLLPTLQARLSPLAASLLVGSVWAGWHAPQLVVPEKWEHGGAWSAAFLYVLMAPALSVLFTWLYNRAGGSVLVVAVAHALFNAVGLFIERASPAIDRSLADEWATLAASWAAAGLVLAFEGRELGRPPRAAA